MPVGWRGVQVAGDGDHDRVSGSSLGGGTFWGLCRLLTKVRAFDEMLELSAKGDNAKVTRLFQKPDMQHIADLQHLLDAGHTSQVAALEQDVANTACDQTVCLYGRVCL